MLKYTKIFYKFNIVIKYFFVLFFRKKNKWLPVDCNDLGLLRLQQEQGKVQLQEAAAYQIFPKKNVKKKKNTKQYVPYKINKLLIWKYHLPIFQKVNSI